MQSKGIFYAVSIGPGGADMLTLQALNVLNNVSVIAYPQTSNAKNIALDCIKQIIDLSEKTLLKCNFTMKKSEREKNYQEALSLCSKELDKGKDVAFISLGDVSLYSTADHILALLKQNGYEVRAIAGVSSVFAASCAAVKELSKNDLPITIISGDSAFCNKQIEQYLDRKGSKVFLKCALHLKEILNIIIKKDLIEHCVLIQNVTMQQEHIWTGIELLNLEKEVFAHSYLCVLIVF